MSDSGMIVDDDAVVSLHYSLSNGFGEVIDSSRGELPLVYMHNTGALLPALEREFTGRRQGDEFDIAIYPEDGYGYAQDELVEEIDIARFESLGTLHVGMRVKLVDGEGESKMMTIREINDDGVVADFNHPLAGQVLYFQIAIVNVREPTTEERGQGFASSTHPGGFGAGLSST